MSEPYFRVSKSAIWKINDSIEGTNASFAIAVYVALVAIANGEGRGDQTKPFTAPITKVAARSGLRYRKALTTVQLLKGIGLLKIEPQVVEGTKLQAPNRFTLCTIDIPLCTVEASNHADSSKNPVITPNERKKDTGSFIKEPLAFEEKELGMEPPTWEEATSYGGTAGHTHEAVCSWWRINTAKNWKLKDKITGKLKLIADWPSALDAFCNAVDNPPSRDKTTNDEFHDWVEAEDLNAEYVATWIELNEKKKWKRKNKLTGKMEPIFDYRASVLAFIRKIESDIESIGK